MQVDKAEVFVMYIHMQFMYNLLHKSLAKKRHVTEGLTLKSRTYLLTVHMQVVMRLIVNYENGIYPFWQKPLPWVAGEILVFLYKTSIVAVLESRIEGECEGHVEKTEDWGGEFRGRGKETKDWSAETEDWGRTTENQGTGT